MKISTKSQYGLRALAYLAKKGEICSVKEIAKRENISFDYLEKIFLALKKAGLVKAKRGVKGGYFLAVPAEKIAVGEIIKALEGTTAPVSCVDRKKIKETCPKIKTCLVKNLWQKICKSWDSSLNSLTLADAISK